MGLQNPGVRFEELQSMNSSGNGPETVSEAAPLDQTLCCYCFMQRADHLIIDCRKISLTPCQYRQLEFLYVVCLYISRWIILDSLGSRSNLVLSTCLLEMFSLHVNGYIHLSIQLTWALQTFFTHLYGRSTFRICAGHLGPCLECSNKMKIEYCAQPNCGTKVTRLLRIVLWPHLNAYIWMDR